MPKSARRLADSNALGPMAGVAGLASIWIVYLLGRLDLPPRWLTDLSFAGGGARARYLLAQPVWADNLADLRRAVFLEWLLIASFTVGIAAAAMWGGARLRSTALRRARGAAAIAGAVAGALGVVENLGLRAMLNGRTGGSWPVITTAAAWPKYFILIPGAAFALTAFAARVKGVVQDSVRRRLPETPELLSFSLVAQTPPQPSSLVPSTTEIGDRPSWREQEWQPTPGRIGICCSGGGVRSAAYNLGALQALREKDVFLRARYLSAVSGGSYIAAAHAIVERDTADRSLLYDGPPEYAQQSPEERALKANTSYLAPSGFGKLRFGFRLLAGLAVNLMFLWLVLFVVSRPVGWVLRLPGVHEELTTSFYGHLVIGPHLWIVIAWPAAVGVLAGLAAVAIRFRKDVRYRATIQVAWGALALAAALFLMLVLIPWVAVVVPLAFRAIVNWLFSARPTGAETRNVIWLLQVLGLTAVGASVIRLLQRHTSKLAMLVAGVIFPATVLMAAALFSLDAARRGPDGRFTIGKADLGSQRLWFFIATAALAFFYSVSDQTTWSMHPFYKRRLATAFALRRKTATRAEPVDYDKLQRLSRYARPPCLAPEGHAHDPTKPHICSLGKACHHDCRPWPELVICAAANVSDIGATPTGRNSISFTFGPHEIGGKDVGWIGTEDMEKALGRVREVDITLPAAVAISGAAISPAMGKMTRPSVAALMAVANARLGVWLPNPRWVRRFKDAGVSFRERPRVQYLVKEILGRHPLEDTFLYVTDGGHFENLGLVELLRRGCTEIYCFDASGDDIDTFFTLGETVALARTELGVEIDINPEALEPDESKPPADPRERRSPTDHVLATIRYPRRDGTAIEGWLVYAKTAVTEDAPWDVKAYGEKDPSFPATGTVHQLFREERFEAYRALGHTTALRAIETMEKATRPDRAPEAPLVLEEERVPRT